MNPGNREPGFCHDRVYPSVLHLLIFLFVLKYFKSVKYNAHGNLFLSDFARSVLYTAQLKMLYEDITRPCFSEHSVHACEMCVCVFNGTNGRYIRE